MFRAIEGSRGVLTVFSGLVRQDFAMRRARAGFARAARKGDAMKAMTMAALVALTGSATGALADRGGNCAPREEVVNQLAESWGETRRSVGLAANNGVVELFASTESGTWTITVTMPGGLTCLVASGQAFEAVAEALPKPGSDA
jgi:hypothetical protein